MTGVLTRPDPKGRGFGFAIALHASLVAVFLLQTWVHPGEKFGDPNAGGASVGVEAVDKIPLPHSGPQNPVAHQSESEAVQEPSKEIEKVQKEVIPPDAIKLNLHEKEKKAKAKEESVKKHLPSFEKLESNQLTSKTPQVVSSPLFTQLPGSGRIGTGANTTLGTRFAGYAAQIQALLGRAWRTGDVNARSGPLVTASFELMKDGTVRNIRIVQGSGIPSLDFSVRRAIEDASPFPPIPPGFDQSYAKCEFTFELKK
jgi:TonB family protein